MNFEQVKEKIASRLGSAEGLPAKVVALDFGSDGVIVVDGGANPPALADADKEADCRLKLSLDDFLKMVSGTLNPQMAFMTGKLQVEGDMGVAMQLGSLLG